MPASLRKKLIGIVGVAAIAAISISQPQALERNADAPVEEPREIGAFDLTGTDAKYSLLTENGQLVVASAFGRTRYELDLSLSVEGTERPLRFKKGGVIKHEQPASLSAAFSVELGDGRADGTLDLGMDPTHNALTIAVNIRPKKKKDKRDVSLRLSALSGASVLFVVDHGELKDLGEVDTRGVVLDDDVHPVAIASRDGKPFTFGQNAQEIETPGVRPRFTTTVDLIATDDKRLHGEVAIYVGNASDVFWGTLYSELLKVPVARVTGTIEGTTGRAEVFALDDAGHPLVRVPTSAGHFVVDAPKTAVRWYAVVESARTSTNIAEYEPGSAKDLSLKMLPGGELHVRVLDADTGLPVLARIAVRGMDGAIDPKFRHDFRATGAGPLVDSRSGEIKTTLPAGRYRVSALKGIEWSIDTEVIDMASGAGQTVELRPRHVVPTPSLVGCDLHVHARPSFDSSVAPEDRLLSLASAGIDFAVPTEHNLVGDYAPFVDRVDLRQHIAHVTGVEVTTTSPAIGHYGVFPYPKELAVPPHNKTKVETIFAASRKADPTSALVVHHPRLPGGLGYFELSSFDPKSGKIPSAMRTDFDLLEVYSGYEIMRREKTETVLRDWFALLELGKRYPATGSSDSHKLQFHWAGYPRTYVRIDDPAQSGDLGGPPNPAAVVGAVKRGEGFITSGPILEFDMSGVRPGGELDMATWNGDGRKVPAHLRVRAAPWVDVTSIEVLAGNVPIFKTAVPSRKTVTGTEPGTIEEAAARAVRYDADITLPIPPKAKWVVVMVRGDRAYDDVLPFMPVQPLAFTNPIWLK